MIERNNPISHRHQPFVQPLSLSIFRASNKNAEEEEGVGNVAAAISFALLNQPQRIHFNVFAVVNYTA